MKFESVVLSEDKLTKETYGFYIDDYLIFWLSSYKKEMRQNIKYRLWKEIKNYEANRRNSSNLKKDEIIVPEIVLAEVKTTIISKIHYKN